MQIVLSYQEIVNAIAFYLKEKRQMDVKDCTVGQDLSSFSYRLIATVSLK